MLDISHRISIRNIKTSSLTILFTKQNCIETVGPIRYSDSFELVNRLISHGIFYTIYKVFYVFHLVIAHFCALH